MLVLIQTFPFKGQESASSLFKSCSFAEVAGVAWAEAGEQPAEAVVQKPVALPSHGVHCQWPSLSPPKGPALKANKGHISLKQGTRKPMCGMLQGRNTV